MNFPHPGQKIAMKKITILFFISLSLAGTCHRASGNGIQLRCPDLILDETPVHDANPEAGILLRCQLVNELISSGLNLNSPLGSLIEAEIVQPYGLEINIEKTTGLAKSALDHMLSDLPETARLINYYQHTSYQVAYTNRIRSRFYASNHDNLSGSYIKLGGRIDTNDSHYNYFQSGQARLLFWRLWGNTIVGIHLKHKSMSRSVFQMQIRVFTRSRVLYGILKSRLFQHLTRSMVKDFLLDIEDAVRQLQTGWLNFPHRQSDYYQALYHIQQQGQ